ncbi:inactive protein RESTRICTED TEV MOVEMENT 2-like [Mercurialis annua]|uniref:inactive protein RESTRICTED TEV MOVEMENT 2-like n=1 Tax=Mercurialis annua TaxID=3986 RepID=UPI0021610942|nr:inactive protein RESTRICTED TEV MOVEMENT 2-like [Mercurialis annua]
MENNGGKRVRFGVRASSRDHSVQEFVPSAAWTEDSEFHFLLIDLPEFKKEEVKLHVDESGQIIVSGERLVKNSNKYIYFEKAFKSPENSDIGRITGKFDGEILYVTLPKKSQAQMKKEPENPIKNDQGVAKDHNVKYDEGVAEDHDMKEKEPSDDRKIGSRESHDDQEQSKLDKEGESKKGSSVDGFRKENIEKWGREGSVLEKATKMLLDNKEILLTAVLAFSLGMLVSRKLESVHHE